MFNRTFPDLVSKDLLKYVKAKQNLFDDCICELFIDQIVEAVCSQANKPKMKKYKVTKEISTLETTEKFIEIEGTKCIVLNLETSPELGEAYPSYAGALDKKKNLFDTDHTFSLRDGDAHYFEGENLAVFKQNCKHKKVLDLYIIQD